MKVIGVDPGFGGGICILDGDKIFIYDIPLIEMVKNGKKKRKYDSLGIVDTIKSHLENNKNVLCGIELVHSNPGEGSVSSFNFGRGLGVLEGILAALTSSEPASISPQSWKKYYPELETSEIAQTREDQKKVSEELRIVEKQNKTVKDKDIKNSNKIKLKELKKDADRLGRQIKSLSKDASRAMALKLAPNFAEDFKLKKNDGRAESLLIANYLRSNYELVQEGGEGEEDD